MTKRWTTYLRVFWFTVAAAVVLTYAAIAMANWALASTHPTHTAWPTETFVVITSASVAWACGTMLVVLCLLVYYRMRKAEQRRHEIAFYYKHLLDTLPTPFFCMDLTHKYTDCNPGFAQLLQRDPDQIIEKTLRELIPPLTPQELRYIEDFDRQAIQLNQPVHFEVPTVISAGERREFVCYQSPLHDTGGKVVGLVGTLLDVTERNRHAAETRQARLHAEKALAEVSHINDKLQGAIARASEMAEAAETASQAKTEFLANMSHEIRTPLTAILGYTELLMDGEMPPSEQIDRLSVVHRNGRHLLGLINDILDISKIEAGKLVLETRPCSVPSIIADAATTLRGRATEKGIDLRVEFATPIPELVHLDDHRLRQILVNLVGNAVKFTATGFVSVTATHLPEWQKQHPAIQIEVQDTGIGIPADKLALIGTPFYQADASTSRRYGGTGLGLAIVRSLVENMGGKFTVTSTEGHGSCFSFVLPTVVPAGTKMLDAPLADKATPQPNNSDPRATPQLNGMCILLAEDGPDNQVLLRTLLQRAGAEVDLVDNGRAACDCALVQPYDVVLMDMQMPQMDGYEAARFLRNNGYRRPIIALTAHAMSSDRQRCIDAGCSDYLTKPIDRSALLQTLLRHAKPRRETAKIPQINLDQPAERPEELEPAAVSRNAGASPARREGFPPSQNAANRQDVPHGQSGAGGTPARREGETPSPRGTPTPLPPIRSELADEPELADVVDSFVKQLPVRLAEMQQAYAAGAMTELTRLAHRLKGAGGSYGYPTLTERGKELEDATQNGDRESVMLALAGFAQVVAAVVQGWPSRLEETRR